MKQQYIFLFPGQASQYVGMGRDLYDNSPAAKQCLDKICQMPGLSHIKDLAFEGPEELLTRTDNVQPAITAVSIMTLSALRERLGKKFAYQHPIAAAGHSLGEYSAHYVAGHLSLETVMNLVQKRGYWMNEVSQPPYPKGAMVAVMGLTMEILEDITQKVGRSEVAVANLNSPGQIILSGSVESIKEVSEYAVAAGAKRTVMLNVSGAWHSPLMKPAQEKMAKLLDQTITPDNVPTNIMTRVVANATAKVVKDVKDICDTLKRQITSPVRWEASVRELCRVAGLPGLPSDLSDEERTQFEPLPIFLEIGPGKVLKGLLRNIDRKLETYNVENIADIDNIEKIVKERS